MIMMMMTMAMMMMMMMMTMTKVGQGWSKVGQDNVNIGVVSNWLNISCPASSVGRA